MGRAEVTCNLIKGHETSTVWLHAGLSVAIGKHLPFDKLKLGTLYKITGLQFSKCYSPQN